MSTLHLTVPSVRRDWHKSHWLGQHDVDDDMLVVVVVVVAVVIVVIMTVVVVVLILVVVVDDDMVVVFRLQLTRMKIIEMKRDEKDLQGGVA